jgi:hypothetical protein
MALLAALHLPGIVIEPIVIFDLRGIVELGADEYHPALRAFDNLPGIPLEHLLPLDRIAKRTRAQNARIRARNASGSGAEIEAGFHKRDSSMEEIWFGL